MEIRILNLLVKTNLVLVDDEFMSNLNKRHLGVDEPTDVLAFPTKEKLPDGVFLLGEIIVNIDAVQRQTKQYKVSEKEELVRLITHGALHLLGYEDKSKKQREKMKEVEDRVLSKIVNVRISKRKTQSAKPSVKFKA